MKTTPQLLLPQLLFILFTFLIVPSINAQILFTLEDTASYSFQQVKGALSHDFDGDGAVELIVQDERLIRYERNDATGYFYMDQLIDEGLINEIDFYAADYKPIGPFFSDLDLDGDADLLVIGNKDTGMQLYWSEYDPISNSFSSFLELFSWSSSEIILDTADLNMDGQFDLAIYQNGQLAVYEILPGANPIVQETVLLSGLNISALELGYADPDAFPDIIYYETALAELFSIPGNGIGGQFFDIGNTSALGITGVLPDCIVLLDVNEDSWGDLVLSFDSQNETALFAGSVSGFGPPETLFYGTTNAFYTISFQKDSDGDPDILIQERDTAWVLENLNAAGSEFGTAQFIPFLDDDSNRMQSIPLEDVNGDGYGDFLISKNQYLDEYFAFQVLCESAGTTISQVSPAQALKANFNTNLGADFADIDGDGDADMIVFKTTLDPNTGAPVGGNEFRRFSLELYENFSEGNEIKFQLLHIYPFYDLTTSGTASANPHAVFSDMDGDGDFDILGNYGGAFWVENDDLNGFDFSFHELGPTGSTNHFVDVNADGDYDLFYRGLNSNLYREFLDAGTGYNDPVVLQNINAHYFGSGDFDNDSDTDILFYRRNVYSYYIYRNFDGQGGQWQQLDLGESYENTSYFYLTDLDNDGQEDILAHTSDLGQVGFVYQKRHIDFPPFFDADELLFSFDPGTLFAIWPIDIYGDNFPDLLVSKTDGSVDLYINDQGVFYEPIQVFNYDTPIKFFADRDLNGDGIPELLGSHFDFAAGSPILVFSFEDINQLKIMFGEVYFDLNENGQLDSGEFGIPDIPVNIFPDNVLKYTNQTGNYQHISSDLDNDFVLSVIPNGDLVGTGVTSYMVPSGGGITNNLDFGLYGESGLINAGLGEFHCPFVCNGSTKFWYTAKNIGYENINGFVAVTFPPGINFHSLSASPDSIDGNTYYYNFENLQPFNSEVFLVISINPDESQVGEIFEFLGEVYIWENGNAVLYDTHFQEIPLSCSFDPNDKLVYPNRAPDPLHPILINDTLEYTIRFQNTGNIPATDVKLVDVLDPWLDWNSFRILGARHEYEVSLNLNTGTLQVLFSNIMLPDSTSDFLGSQGAFEFSIELKEDAPIGTLIENTADIFFDLNPAVVTNTTTSTLVEFLPGDCTDEVVIEINPEVPGNVYCPNAVVNLSVPDVYTNYQWYYNFSNSNVGGTPIIDGLGANYVVNINEWGFAYFYVEVQNANCEYVSEPVLIDSYVFLFPVIASDGQTEFCQGDSALIYYPAAGGAQFQWFQDGNPIPGANDSLYWVTQTGTYVLE
ncbi:MAG: hypothetical protein KDC34_20485, partial [Saprospiraceae bacterium]|nr:hypothetical protein [Saprospiraceae bacterium]